MWGEAQILNMHHKTFNQNICPGCWVNRINSNKMVAVIQAGSQIWRYNFQLLFKTCTSSQKCKNYKNQSMCAKK